jgi:hypothetical protein
VAVFAAALLLFCSPLMRGGNRQVALVALESIAVALLLTLSLRGIFKLRRPLAFSGVSPRTLLIALVLLSPAWLALVYLLPVPTAFWSGTPGREIYVPLMRDAGLSVASSLPLSLVPDATRASLIAGVPLIAGFAAGYMARLPQLKLLLGLVVAMAFAQILLGFAQVAGGAQSALYFGGDGGRPFGTFANANHFANYVGMALAAYVWLCWSSLRHRRRISHNVEARFASRHAFALWIAGGLVLVVGILMSRSRGAAITGLPAGLLSMGLALHVSSDGDDHRWRFTVGLVGAILAAAVVLVGLGSVLSRFELSGMAGSASIRSVLAATTLVGAREFWPWGAGWGTFAAVYPRYEPMGSDGIADYAHQDYAQMLFEGGVFSMILFAAGLWLAGSRAVVLVKAIRKRGRINEEMACALCGLGLLGLLLHSLVEFNMHIPANAILASLMAGAYLRPLGTRDTGR